VFELRSQIAGRTSSKAYEISSAMYEPKQFEIQIENTFLNSEFGDF
jgi:hypothetical protein